MRPGRTRDRSGRRPWSRRRCARRRCVRRPRPSRPYHRPEMCEQYIARAVDPFRLDTLWSFTERLERFGIAGFGWGATWLDPGGALRSYRDIGSFADDSTGQETVGAVSTRA